MDLYGLITPGGYIAASVTYPCTDIVGEVYGKSYARKIVTCGLAGLGIFLVLIQVDLILPAADFWEYESAYNTILGASPRFVFAGFLAIIVGQYADVSLFSYLRKLTNGRFLWIRNNGSTALSKLLDCTAFNFVAFWGVYDFSQIIDFTIVSYLFYVLIAFLDTPFVYLGVWWIRKRHPELRDKDESNYGQNASYI